MGTTVLQVIATDPDEGPAGTVSYKIDQVCSVLQLFRKQEYDVGDMENSQS